MTAQGRSVPVPSEQTIAAARRLDNLATQRANNLPAALLTGSLPSRAELDAVRCNADRLLGQMIACQEELDWQVYHLRRTG